jgi:uncharacterized protein (DUF2236 family)
MKSWPPPKQKGSVGVEHKHDTDPWSQGFFSPSSMIWRVDREMILLLAGGHALLLQLAHPKVAAGVAEHSHFKEDPLGRLHRTMNTMWSIVFDEVGQASAALERVKNLHKKVRGAIRPGEPLPLGVRYDAADCELLLWVHATLIDSALAAYGLFVEPLSVGERSRYYGDSKKLGALFDIPETMLPASLAKFDSYMTGTVAGDCLVVGPSARSLAMEILYPRPWVLKPAGPVFRLITAGLLPPRLRKAYGLSWNERREQVFRLLARTIRALLPLVPQRLRVVPQARAAERRAQMVPRSNGVLE